MTRCHTDCVCSDDLYEHQGSWPSPAHRARALASQASMLYVILYFSPETLHKETAVMREIVDKHFPDNWVITFYLGYTVDLSHSWQPYKAATSALNNTLHLKQVQSVLNGHVGGLKNLFDELTKYLTEGVLTEDLVLDRIPTILDLIRDCNHSLRWLILHRTTVHKKVREVVYPAINAHETLKLLLRTSQFEYVFKRMFAQLVDKKPDLWNACKGECVTRMTELSDHFSGTLPLTRVAKDEQLQQW